MAFQAIIFTDTDQAWEAAVRTGASFRESASRTRVQALTAPEHELGSTGGAARFSRSDAIQARLVALYFWLKTHEDTAQNKKRTIANSTSFKEVFRT